MSAMEISTVKARQSAAEIDWRHVWLTNVMIDRGKTWPPKVARHKTQTWKDFDAASVQTSSHAVGPRPSIAKAI